MTPRELPDRHFQRRAWRALAIGGAINIAIIIGVIAAIWSLS